MDIYNLVLLNIAKQYSEQTAQDTLIILGYRSALSAWGEKNLTAKNLKTFNRKIIFNF